MTYTEYLELQKNIKEHPESFIDYERMIEEKWDGLEMLIELMGEYEATNGTALAEVIDVADGCRWGMGWDKHRNFAFVD